MKIRVALWMGRLLLGSQHLLSRHGLPLYAFTAGRRGISDEIAQAKTRTPPTQISHIKKIRMQPPKTLNRKILVEMNIYFSWGHLWRCDRQTSGCTTVGLRIGIHGTEPFTLLLRTSLGRSGLCVYHWG